MNMTKKDKLTIAAVGDLHVGAHGGTRQFDTLFNELSERANIIVLCGDLTNVGTVEEAQRLAADLKKATVPVVGVLGNHDHESGVAGEVERILMDAGLRPLEQRTQEIAGIGFAGVKGYGGGFGQFALGSFGEPATKEFVQESINEAMRLENGLHQLAHLERVIVALHYAPIAATCEGEPREIFPYLGSTRLEETIDRFPNIKIVFHGHAHRGARRGTTARGVPVINCAHQPEHPYELLEL
jgi:Icc-related predicted phosphoesterase